MAPLFFRFFGPFRVFQQEQELQGIQSDKARGLLAYLAAEAYVAHSRARLAALFWPDLAEQRARAYLRHNLSNLRKVLHDHDNPTPVLLATRSSLQFNRQCDHRLDLGSVTTFADHLAAGAPDEAALLRLAQQAVDAYDGPFLDGLTVLDSPDFDHWLSQWRDCCLETVCTALDRLAGHAEKRGAWPAALAHVERRLALQPWSEETHRHKMRLLWRMGNRTGALQQYATCVRFLAEELDVAPDTETEALRARIEAAADAPVDELPAPQPVSPPVLRPAGASLTSLIGRAAELERLVELVRARRLVTLTGPGGVGKTRLALAAAERAAGYFAHGVYTVPLASIENPDFVWYTVLSALHLTVTGRQSALERLIDHFAGKEALLLLDNLEHLLPVAPEVAVLCREAPRLHLLITSRAPLHLYGEQEAPVAPLVMPDPEHPAADWADTAAVRLFVERVQQSMPGFQLDACNAQAVQRICVALDGLPLALELAAAQLKYMTPQELLNQLARRENLAWRAASDRPPRQETLAETVGWSYDLLDPEGQQLFRRLGVFRGGFTVRAVGALFPDDNAGQIMTRLRTLMDAGLVQRLESRRTAASYTMLETIRQVSMTLLEESGQASAAYRAHVHYFLELAQEAEEATRQLGVQAQLDDLGAEIDNLRAALQWALAQGEDRLAIRLGTVLGGYWVIRHHGHEGLEWLNALLALPALAGMPLSAARLRRFAGRLAEYVGDYPRSRRLLEEALHLARNTGDQLEIAHALSFLGITMRTMGDYTAALAVHRESLALFQAQEDRRGAVVAVKDVGLCYQMLADFAAAEACYADALAWAADLDDPFLDAYLLGKLGDAAAEQGRRAEARPILARSLELFQPLEQYAMFAAYVRIVYGRLLLAEGEPAQALDAFRISLALWSDMGYLWATTFGLSACALAMARLDRPAASLQLVAFVEAAGDRTGMAVQSNHAALHDGVRDLVHAALDAQAIAAAHRLGAQMSMAQAVELALADGQ